jgi:hypothetical protein
MPISHVIENEDWLSFSDEIVLKTSVLSNSDFFSVLGSQEKLIAVSIDVFGRIYKYYDLLDVSIEDMMTKERFLADYHVLRYLEKESLLDRVSVGRVAVALSNLLRLCSGYDIDELHYLSLRIIRKFSEKLQKDIFIITEY